MFSLELTFLYSWWAKSEITVYVDPEDLQSLKQEYALNLVNHRYEIDWLVGLVAAQKLGLLGVISSIGVAAPEPSDLSFLPGLENCWKTFLKFNSDSRLVMVFHRIDFFASRLGK